MIYENQVQTKVYKPSDTSTKVVVKEQHPREVKFLDNEKSFIKVMKQVHAKDYKNMKILWWT